MATTDQLMGYTATCERAGYYPVPSPGTLIVQGEDRFAFFQRQTTNDTNSISPTRSLVTVLTSPTARILDVLRLIERGESLTVLTLPGGGAETVRYLISRIFFMDKVSLEDRSPEYAQVELEGALAADILIQIGFSRAASIDEIITTNLWGNQCLVAGQRGLIGSGYRLLLPARSLPALEAALVELGVERISHAAHNVLRVEAGLPAAGAELTDSFTPLETGLQWAIAENKGCYTGQEVIARQITYDKITQSLAGLSLSQPAQPGDPLWAEGRQVGRITSTARSPIFGEIALAVIKRPFHEPGGNLQVGTSASDEPIQTATVSQLPFRR